MLLLIIVLRTLVVLYFIMFKLLILWFVDLCFGAFCAVDLLYGVCGVICLDWLAGLTCLRFDDGCGLALIVLFVLHIFIWLLYDYIGCLLSLLLFICCSADWFVWFGLGLWLVVWVVCLRFVVCFGAFDCLFADLLGGLLFVLVCYLFYYRFWSLVLIWYFSDCA